MSTEAVEHAGKGDRASSAASGDADQLEDGKPLARPVKYLPDGGVTVIALRDLAR